MPIVITLSEQYKYQNMNSKRVSVVSQYSATSGYQLRPLYDVTSAVTHLHFLFAISTRLIYWLILLMPDDNKKASHSPLLYQRERRWYWDSPSTETRSDIFAPVLNKYCRRIMFHNTRRRLLSVKIIITSVRKKKKKKKDDDDGDLSSSPSSAAVTLMSSGAVLYEKEFN